MSHYRDPERQSAPHHPPTKVTVGARRPTSNTCLPRQYQSLGEFETICSEPYRLSRVDVFLPRVDAGRSGRRSKRALGAFRVSAFGSQCKAFARIHIGPAIAESLESRTGRSLSVQFRGTGLSHSVSRCSQSASRPTMDRLSPHVTAEYERMRVSGSREQVIVAVTIGPKLGARTMVARLPQQGHDAVRLGGLGREATVSHMAVLQS
mgnify:CR=1 FL=1|jgi:hypothetical protein